MERSVPDPHAGWTARRVRASGLSVLLALAVVVAVLVARGVFVAARQPIGWVAAAAAVAFVLAPVVGALDRRLPRAVAIVVTLALGVGFVATVGWSLLVEVQDQLEQLADRLPAAADEIEAERGPDSVLAEIGLSDLVGDLVDQVSNRLAPPRVDRAVGTAPAYFVSGVLVVFFLVWGRAIVEGAERQITDDVLRRRAGVLGRRAAANTQRYVVGALAIAVTVAVLGGLLAWWVELPTPLVLGVLIGAASLVPYLGVLFGGAPMLLLAAATQPGSRSWLVVLALVALQAGATGALRTLVEPRCMRVGPALLVVATLVGFDVYGAGGALVALVLAAAIAAVVDVIGSPDPV